MSRAKRKLQLLTAFAVLLLAATAVSCKGFFVNSPDSLTISPDTITFTTIGDPQQLTAQATFGTRTENVTSSTIWQSSDGCKLVASTTNIGQMTAIGSGSSVTITATYNGVTDTVTASVPTGISITPCGTNGKFSAGTSQTFTAKASGTDVTASATWSSDNTNIVHFTAGSAATFGPTTGTAVITASDGTATDGHLLVTVQ